MAYAESTVGGNYGGNYRVWVNSIRTYDGNQAENYENWRVEGGLNKVGGGTAYNYNGSSSYTVQLGMNGVASSGNFNYSWGDVRGTVLAWGTGATSIGRTSAGYGFGFQSRMDIDLANSPYLTSGWVTSNDSVQTKLRFGDITSISPTASLTDETTSIAVGWYKYVGTAHLWFRLDALNNTDSTYHITNPGNPYTWSGFATWLRTSMVNTNSTTLYIYYGDDVDSNGSVDNWKGPWTYGITIKNDTGQANPTFTDFTYLDTNAATVAVTGSDQVLIQSKSTLSATVSVANRAIANKNATMSSYTFTVGSYTANSTWSNVASVTKNIGVVSDVSGIKDLSVKATDSRTNYKTVTKSVTILPYISPAFVPELTVNYTNDYDNSDGLTVVASGTIIAKISPMTLSGTDKNAVSADHAVQFDISKSNNTSYTGTYEDITVARTAGSSDVTATLATIATDILTKMNDLTADSTVKWYVKFKIVDALETQYYETFIDIGRPIFRIGTDGYVYNSEERIFSALSQYTVGTVLITTVNTNPQTIFGGTWSATTTPSQSLFGMTLYGWRRTA